MLITCNWEPTTKNCNPHWSEDNQTLSQVGKKKKSSLWLATQSNRNLTCLFRCNSPSFIHYTHTFRKEVAVPTGRQTHDMSWACPVRGWALYGLHDARCPAEWAWGLKSRPSYIHQSDYLPQKPQGAEDGLFTYARRCRRDQQLSWHLWADRGAGVFLGTWGKACLRLR